MLRRMPSDAWKQFKLVVIDECQAIKNPDSTQTACVRSIAKQQGMKVIPTSGTPWKNKASEFFPVLNILDATMFNSFEAFKKKYVAYDDDGKECGLRKPEEFWEQIKHIAVRRERWQVMPELPLINRTSVDCEVDEFARMTYKAEEDKLVAIYNNAVLSGEENSFETQQLLNKSIMIMRQIVGIAKVPATVDYVTEFLEDCDRNIVISAHHIKCQEMIYGQLAKYCEDNKLAKPLLIDGKMNGAESIKVQNDFNASKSRILVVSALAAGEGLNLQTCCDIITHERQWNPANEEQFEGRVARIGQKSKHINSIYMHGEDTCDQIVGGIVERKRMNFHSSMNKGSAPTWNENELTKQVIEQIIKNRKNK
jgi:SNF2 family DNA or RNA helicase